MPFDKEHVEGVRRLFRPTLEQWDKGRIDSKEKEGYRRKQ
jgi:hypothetical protein